MQCDAVTRITINILLIILIFQQKGINEYVFSNITFRSISLISVLTVLFYILVQLTKYKKRTVNTLIRLILLNVILLNTYYRKTINIHNL